MKAQDVVTATFLVGLSLLVLAVRHRLTDWPWLLARFLFFLALQVAVVAGRSRGLPLLPLAFFPVLPVVGIYDSLGFIPALNPVDRDDILARLDRALLRTDPGLWLASFGAPWLTDLLQLAYLVYYVLPFLLLGTLYRRQGVSGGQPEGSGKSEAAFDLCVVALLLSHYLAFVGYMLVPALGPRFVLAPRSRTDAPGLLVADPIRHLLDALEGVKRDAFPSGHTSAALISLHYAFRFAPHLARHALAPVLLMILSTVYLRYHYVADVLAGGILAILCILIAPRLLRQPRPGGR